MKEKKLTALMALWLLAISLVSLSLFVYENRPGDASRPPEIWPAASQIVPHDLTLVLFAHPHCPCTRASLDELAMIMARSGGRLAAQVVFIQPDGQSAAWHQSDLWRSAQSIPGVTVQTDPGATEARLFHATTSGQVVLYEHGRLRFDGGITWGRGHAGDNSGRRAILAVLNQLPSPRVPTAVFGCALFGKIDLAHCSR